ncbi:MAG TPA: HipA domain-containing protein [Oligoflexus sp.]|uniref:HipA domain-containing protein n=1 Tax=Oligoflexus sp. TaxID=1971216 RepID=UPI002D32BC7A|nr:HipA domain-containing protein [Oligoflexus sp.]HYX34919.1 HipA domain-containing protein [Oligoflexus sp.]
MNRCPITYEPCGSAKYSDTGLKRISSKLSRLEDLPFDAKDLRDEALQRASRMSIQGVQPKVSAILSIKESRFEIVDYGGKYILKPQSNMFHQLPENEDLTMRLAEVSGMNVPKHGLVYAKDQSLVYFIERFDRKGRSSRIAVEDFAQLAGESRATKYNYSMERVASIIEQYCTFPVIEKAEFFRRTIFNYLVGNEDMHLKNFSVIVTDDIVRLAPVYDFVNSSIALRHPAEEMALTLNGKKKNFTRNILVNYFGRERLKLESKVIDEQFQRFSQDIPQWFECIDKSFLSKEFQGKYREVVESRAKVLQLDIRDG